MSQYKYATVLEAQNDGKPPNDNIEKGTRILKPGEHDTDTLPYLGEDGEMEKIRFERVELIEADRRMNAAEIERYAKDQYFDGEPNEDKDHP